MRFERLGFEFRVELAAEEPWMVRSFDDLNIVFVGGTAGDAETSGGQNFFVVAIEFVAMAMTFADLEFSVCTIRERSGLEFAGPRPESHCAAHFVNAEKFAQFIDDAVR